MGHYAISPNMACIAKESVSRTTKLVCLLLYNKSVLHIKKSQSTDTTVCNRFYSCLNASSAVQVMCWIAVLPIACYCQPTAEAWSVMRMKIEGIESVREIFSIFHDGSLVSYVADGDTLRLEIEIHYLAERVNPYFRTFNVCLFGVDDVQFSPWPSDLKAKLETISELPKIFEADLEILECTLQEGVIEVVCNQHSPAFAYCGGELRVRCTCATVIDEAGKAYSIEELGALCNGYWNDWSKRDQA